MDPQKRQKKLARRKAKERTKRKANAAAKSVGISQRIAQSLDAPILHCCTTSALWEVGLANLLVSRQLRGGDVVAVMFLLDVYCLGVKDVFIVVTPRSRYEATYYAKMVGDAERVPLDPPAARKLIEGAVAFARSYGLSPAKDYAKGMAIFGDIDAAQCQQSFEYGKGGKPFFVAGPNDGPRRCMEIMQTLNETCGPDGFHYMMPLEVAKPLGITGNVVEEFVLERARAGAMSVPGRKEHP